MAVKLITWFIISYGLMNIMVFGSIFSDTRNFIRNWAETPEAPMRGVFDFINGILSCPMCFSFHGGWFLSLVVFSPTYELFGTALWISWFFDGILSSGAVWAINSIIEYFEENRIQKNN